VRRLKLHRRQCSRATLHRSTPVMGSGVTVLYQHWIRRPLCRSSDVCWPSATLSNSSAH
jgi:hypothetical protein